MKIDYNKLNTGLNTLKGTDYNECEKKARALGDISPDLNYSKTFQAVIASKVLEVGYDEIVALPIKEFVNITSIVNNFLLEDLIPFLQGKLLEK